MKLNIVYVLVMFCCVCCIGVVIVWCWSGWNFGKVVYCVCMIGWSIGNRLMVVGRLFVLFCSGVSGDVICYCVLCYVGMVFVVEDWFGMCFLRFV